MVQTLWLIRDKVLSFLREERAQDAFEYILITGVVTTAVLVALALVPGLMPAVIHGVCLAIKAIPAMGGMTCVAP